MRLLHSDRDAFSPIQDQNFISAVHKYNVALKELQQSRIQESIMHMRELLAEAQEHKNKEAGIGSNPLHYPIIDRCSIVLEHLQEIQKYI